MSAAGTVQKVNRRYWLDWVETLEFEDRRARSVLRTATGVVEEVIVSAAMQKSVLLDIARLADWDLAGYGARPGAGTIAKSIRHHVRTVRDALKVLKELQLLDVVREGGGRMANAYRLVQAAGKRRDRRAASREVSRELSRSTPPLAECHTTPPPPDRFGVGLEGHLHSSGAEKHKHDDAQARHALGASSAGQSAAAAAEGGGAGLRAHARALAEAKAARKGKKWRHEVPLESLESAASEFLKGLRRP